MPKLVISKSVHINATAEKVYSVISDFNQWQVWSPWMIMDPKVKVTVAPDAQYYEWEGDSVGSGNMTIIGFHEFASVDYNLLFLKPWKSKAKVRFEIKPVGEGVMVTWFMDSSLPFFMFWMKKLTEAFIGMDYNRGLMMLKDYVEEGLVPSKLDFIGENSFEESAFIGLKNTCSKDEMQTKKQADFDKLWQVTEAHKDLVDGKGFCIYHKWDMVKDEIEYTVGIQMKAMPENLDDGFVKGQLNPSKTYRLGHVGPHRHLGNAWSTMYSLQRSKVFKANKKIHPFEVYTNLPSEVDENDLSTVVHFALK